MMESSEESAAAIDALDVTLVHANQTCEVVQSAPILMLCSARIFLSNLLAFCNDDLLLGLGFCGPLGTSFFK
jgi:hypothetical protein